MPTTTCACSVGRLTTAIVGARRAGPPRRRCPAGRTGEALLDGGHGLVVVDRSGQGDDHVGRTVVLGEEPLDVLAPHGRDGLLVAQHVPAERVVGEQGLEEHLVHEVGGLVGVHQDLLEDHLALGLDLVGPEGRLPHDVGEDVEAELEVLRQHARRTPCTPWW